MDAVRTGAACLAVCLSGWCPLAAASPATAGQQTGERERSVWYTFDDPLDLGRSVGVTPWPAHPHRTRWGTVKTGNALVMPGTVGNGLMLPNPAAFFGEQAAAGTIALWVKPDFDPAEETRPRVLIDFARESRNTLVDGHEIVILSDGPRLGAQAVLTRRMYVDTPLARDRWTHLALTWDAVAGSALYVDGELAAERPGAFTPTALDGWPGRLGSHTPSGGYPFRGAARELRLVDRMLSSDEIALLRDPPRPPVSGLGSGPLRITNRHSERTTAHLREWLAERTGDQNPWGYLPLPEHEIGSGVVYTGGASGACRRLGETLTLAPNGHYMVPLPACHDYYAKRRVSVMTGEGLARREVAAKDYQGILCTTDLRSLRTDGRPVVALTILNDTGRAYHGKLGLDVRRLSGKSVSSVAARVLSLEHGQETTWGITLADEPLPVGSYLLRPWAASPAGERCPLRPVPLRVVEDSDYRTMLGVGAAYVAHPPSSDLLSRMADDGVKVVRRSRSQWWNEDRTVDAHGFRAWYTAAFSSRSICTSPEVVEQTEQLARQLGACYRDKPTVLNQVMLGEGLNRPPCYCDHCNRAFRTWLRAKYGDVETLNARWESTFASFDEINQLGSPEDVDLASERMKLMQRELPEAQQKRWQELFQLDPARGIEWKRWHESVLLDWYSRFARAFHETNQHATALSEQPCWPNFKHHVLFHLGEVADLGGMDLYLPGELPTTLGYASELCCNFDMNASIFHDRPKWVHELYVQDNSPPGLAEAQGWWLVGRGYSMLTYFTYDHYKEGVRANLPLIFGMFDKEWKPYPCYDSFARFSRDLRKFHEQYDAHSLHRVEPEIALYLSDDMSLANSLETGDATWGAAGVHGHIGAYWLTERNGYPVDFVNDAGLDRLEGKRALVVPWTHVIRRDSLAKILGFARNGGAVIFDGPVALFDEVYQPYSRLPGGEAMRELGVRLAEYRDEPNELIVGDSVAGVPAGTKITTRGVPWAADVRGGDLLATDGKGRPALVRVALGKGQVFMFLTNLGRTHRSRKPDANAVALWRSVLGSAGLRGPVAWVEKGSAETEAPAPGNLDHGGAGVPEGDACFDVSLRRRGDDELFLFMVSFFNGTNAEVTVRLPAGEYEAMDALTREQVSLRRVEDGYSLPVRLDAFGTQVVRIARKDGPVTFASRH